MRLGDGTPGACCLALLHVPDLFVHVLLGIEPKKLEMVVVIRNVPIRVRVRYWAGPLGFQVRRLVSCPIGGATGIRFTHRQFRR